MSANISLEDVRLYLASVTNRRGLSERRRVLEVLLSKSDELVAAYEKMISTHKQTSKAIATELQIITYIEKLAPNLSGVGATGGMAVKAPARALRTTRNGKVLEAANAFAAANGGVVDVLKLTQELIRKEVDLLAGPGRETTVVANLLHHSRLFERVANGAYRTLSAKPSPAKPSKGKPAAKRAPKAKAK